MIRKYVYCLSVRFIYSVGIYFIFATNSSFKNEIKFTTQNMNNESYSTGVTFNFSMMFFRQGVSRAIITNNSLS